MHKILSRLKYYAAVVLFLLTSSILSVGPAVLAGTAAADPIAATSPLSYTGQGIPLDQQCDNNNTPYLLFIFSYGGNYNPTNVTLHGISVTSQSEMGNETHFTTAYANPSTLINTVNVTWNGNVGNAQLVISHGCAGAPALTHVTPAAVTFDDQCGTINDKYTVPTTTGVTYSAAAGTYAGSGTVTITASANQGYTLDGTSSWSHMFTDVPCYVPPTPVTPAAVTFIDLCGTANDTYTVPATAGVTYSVSTGTYPGTGTVNVTATANAGFVLMGTASWSHTFSTEPCYVPPTPVTPATVTFTDLCGTANDTYTVPVTAGVTYSASAGSHQGTGAVTVTASANAGYVLSGTTSWSHTFTDVPCDSSSVTLCHATDSRHNPYVLITISAAGAYDGHYTQHQGPVYSPLLPKHTKWGDIIPQFNYNGQTYSLNALAGASILDNDCNASTPKPKHVVAAPVTFKDITCDEHGSYSVPETDHVTYKDAQGNVIAAGTYSVTTNTTVTITAYADAGYTLKGNHTWTHKFMVPENCVNPCDEDEGENVVGLPMISMNHDHDNDSDDDNADCGGGGTVVVPPTVEVTPSVCVLPLALTGSVTVKVTNPNALAINYSVSLSGVATPQFVLVPAHSSASVTFNNLPAGNYTASVMGAGTNGSAQATVTTCATGGTGGGNGGGGQVLGASTSVPAVVAAVATPVAVGHVLADTGANTILPTILALSLALTATGVMFGSRKFRNKLSAQSAQ